MESEVSAGGQVGFLYRRVSRQLHSLHSLLVIQVGNVPFFFVGEMMETISFLERKTFKVMSLYLFTLPGIVQPTGAFQSRQPLVIRH